MHDPDQADGEPGDIGAATDDEAAQLPLLREPAEGIPEPVASPTQLQDLLPALGAVTGPVALDAERASGYRYSQRAYLVQLRREGAGTLIIDPIAVPDLGPVAAAITGSEWILHAANQDLPCLAELGLVPDRLFDTELAGRLLGDERVALGTMVERHLGVRLEKGHSAADWSRRPLPRDWLAYAALDVELLSALRDELARLLSAAGKAEWAAQEFDWLRRIEPAAPRAEPWRRTSGIHRTRSRRQLAIVRALWVVRDEYAAQRDIAPGRVLPDRAIVEAARALPSSPDELAALPVFGGPRQRRSLSRWFAAIQRARNLPESELPAPTGPSTDAIPPSSRWRDRDPEAAARLSAAREVVAEIGERRRVLAQNLLASDVLRRLAWQPPSPLDAQAVRERLTELGARPWQIELTAADLARALASA